MIDKNKFKDFDFNDGVDLSETELLHLKSILPTDYQNFVQTYNGGEGEIGEEYLVLHKAEELIEINTDVKISDFDNKLFIIGSNGGGEYVAIDFRNDTLKYIIIPFIFEYAAIKVLAYDIDDLFNKIYIEGYFGK